MDYLAVTGIAIGLAMDAFAVSVTNGALTKKVTVSLAVKLAFFFGLFQFAMPIIGWLIGKVGEEFIKNVDHWVAFALLLIIGGKMILDYIRERKESAESLEKHDPITIKTVILLAVATSIDALATGIILPSAIRADTVFSMLIAVTIIGIITFIISFVGVYLGKFFGGFLSHHATLVGGIVLILIGGKILFDHLM